MEHHMDINRRVDQILMGAAEDCLSGVLHAPKVRSAVALFFSRVSASMVEMVEEVERAPVSAALVAPKAHEVDAEGGASDVARVLSLTIQNAMGLGPLEPCSALPTNGRHIQSYRAQVSPGWLYVSLREVEASDLERQIFIFVGVLAATDTYPPNGYFYKMKDISWSEVKGDMADLISEAEERNLENNLKTLPRKIRDALGMGEPEECDNPHSDLICVKSLRVKVPPGWAYFTATNDKGRDLEVYACVLTEGELSDLEDGAIWDIGFWFDPSNYEDLDRMKEELCEHISQAEQRRRDADDRPNSMVESFLRDVETHLGLGPLTECDAPFPGNGDLHTFRVKVKPGWAYFTLTIDELYTYVLTERDEGQDDICGYSLSSVSWKRVRADMDELIRDATSRWIEQGDGHDEDDGDDDEDGDDSW